jgi:hypothetical protein
VRDDTAWKYIAVHPALVIAPSDTSRFLLAMFDSTPRRSALWMTAPATESLASLELLSLDGKTAGRWRAAITPVPLDPAKRGISDLLLFDAADSLATHSTARSRRPLGQTLFRRAEGSASIGRRMEMPEATARSPYR